MSIATMRGDGGETGLAGGIRVSKSSDRVEAYGTIDELISTMGFARSICADEEIGTLTKAIQKELFKVGSAIATPPEGAKKPPEITDAMVDALTAQVHRIEAIEGILADWSIPGEHTEAAAYDVARTVCRRAERLAVAVRERGIEVQPNVDALSQPAVGLAVAIRPVAGTAGGRECQAAGRCACRPAMVASLVMSVVEAVDRESGGELGVKVGALLRQRGAGKRDARDLFDAQRLDEESRLGRAALHLRDGRIDAAAVGHELLAVDRLGRDPEDRRRECARAGQSRFSAPSGRSSSMYESPPAQRHAEADTARRRRGPGAFASRRRPRAACDPQEIGRGKRRQSGDDAMRGERPQSRRMLVDERHHDASGRRAIRPLAPILQRRFIPVMPVDDHQRLVAHRSLHRGDPVGILDAPQRVRGLLMVARNARAGLRR